MRADPPQAIHATAVAIGGRALLIRGPSRAGKSRLSLALIARATPALPIVLIGDDRILLHLDAGALVARPHPRIAGFVERRGLGIVAMPWIARAPVGGIVDLCRDGDVESRSDRGLLRGLPRLEIVRSHDDEEDGGARVLDWWADRAANP